ncbi:MAG: GDP-mannose 4,6-dehydratase, partial [Candidatus Levybacteria bacterium]|nr:GDP-mannose 4,6-dehydratase [Candidatus Levybacteria bacterium]
LKNNYVVVVDNFSQGSMNNLKEIKANKNLRIIDADILDMPKMLQVTKNIDIIFHLATQCLRVSLKNPFLVNEVNTTGTLNVLWAAHKNKIKKFLYCSSSEVYGSALSAPMKEDHPLNPTTVYGASKLQGEIYAKCFNDNFGLPTIIARPFNTYGFNEHFVGPYGEVIPRFIARIKNNLPPIIYGPGTQTRDFTFVSDTVNGLILAASSDRLNGQAINIAYGKEITINKIAKIIIELLNSKIRVKYQPSRPKDVKRHYADISKAKKILNFKPEIDIGKGIKMYLEYLNTTGINFKTILKKIPERNWQ